MSHTCHALACETPVPPRLHMCAKHWRMVPKAQQSALWANYRLGQERDKQPSVAYLLAAAACVAAVARKEGMSEEAIANEVSLYEAWADLIDDERVKGDRE